MSLPESALRQSNAPVTLPPLGQTSPDVVARQSQTHWAWTPYRDINNMMPWGIKSQLGYRNQRWTLLKRCTPYPLGNLTHQEADRATVAELHNAGITNISAPPIQITKYAQAQAAELGESYSDTGFRVLLPFLGMDDAEIVGQIIQVVQPFAYDIHEMAREFTDGAAQRIEESALSEDEKAKAYQVAEIMLHGAMDAERTATREYNALITSMGDAQVGKPGIAEPNDFHRWICVQLNKPIPKRVDRSGGSGDGDSATVLKVLLERDNQREQRLAAQQRELDELRAQVAGQGAKAAEPVAETPPARHDGKLLSRK